MNNTWLNQEYTIWFKTQYYFYYLQKFFARQNVYSQKFSLRNA